MLKNEQKFIQLPRSKNGAYVTRAIIVRFVEDPPIAAYAYNRRHGLLHGDGRAEPAVGGVGAVGAVARRRRT